MHRERLAGEHAVETTGGADGEAGQLAPGAPRTGGPVVEHHGRNPVQHLPEGDAADMGVHHVVVGRVVPLAGVLPEPGTGQRVHGSGVEPVAVGAGGVVVQPALPGVAEIVGAEAVVVPLLARDEVLVDALGADDEPLAAFLHQEAAAEGLDAILRHDLGDGAQRPALGDERLGRAQRPDARRAGAVGGRARGRTRGRAGRRQHAAHPGPECRQAPRSSARCGSPHHNLTGS